MNRREFIALGALAGIGATRDFVARLREEGYTTEFLEFTGGHTVPASISDAAFRWLAGESI